MHELSIIQSVIKTVLKNYRPEEDEKITSVSLVMGAMNDYEEYWMNRYFARASAGTALEGAVLKLTVVPVSFRCLNCGRVFEMVREKLFEASDVSCPCCKSLNYEMKTGREFYVKEIEVEKT